MGTTKETAVLCSELSRLRATRIIAVPKEESGLLEKEMRDLTGTYGLFGIGIFVEETKYTFPSPLHKVAEGYFDIRELGMLRKNIWGDSWTDLPTLQLLQFLEEVVENHADLSVFWDIVRYADRAGITNTLYCVENEFPDYLKVGKEKFDER